jgi:hypothetical protein
MARRLCGDTLPERTAYPEGPLSNEIVGPLSIVVRLSLRDSGRSRGDALQLPKRIKRSKRYEFEAHQVRPADRQLLEHIVRGNRVGYVQEERDTASTLKREPVIDLAIEIKLHRFAGPRP